MKDSMDPRAEGIYLFVLVPKYPSRYTEVLIQRDTACPACHRVFHSNVSIKTTEAQIKYAAYSLLKTADTCFSEASDSVSGVQGGALHTASVQLINYLLHHEVPLNEELKADMLINSL